MNTVRPRPIGIRKLGEFPSADDTSYARAVGLGGGRFLVSWYSSPLKGDPSWITGLQDLPISGKQRSVFQICAGAVSRSAYSLLNGRS